MSALAIDVVVLAWNDGALLQAAVESALESTGVDVSVIVVDNGSDPPAELEPDARVRLLRNPVNRGVAAGRNQGAAGGSAPLVCFLDSDARLAPGALRRLTAPFAEDPRVALAGPVFDGQAPEASAGRAPSPVDKVLRALNLSSTYRPVARGGPWWDVDFAIGACQLVRRHAFTALGGFDESYFYGPEDVDLCLRLRSAGWRVVQVASAGCHHPPRRRAKGVLTARAWRHGWAVARHLWRHRRFVAGTAGAPWVAP